MSMQNIGRCHIAEQIFKCWNIGIIENRKENHYSGTLEAGALKAFIVGRLTKRRTGHLLLRW